MNTRQEFPASKRGRPRKGPAAFLKAQFWHWAVQCLNDNSSRSRSDRRRKAFASYSMEKRFSRQAKQLMADRANGIRLDEHWAPTGKTRKHRAGKVPRDDYAMAVDVEIPGSRRFLLLPHWEIMDVPAPSVERLYELLSELRPDISGILFRLEIYRGGRTVLARRPHLYRQLSVLDRESDFDALVACLGIVREIEHFRGLDTDHYLAAVTARQIFLRLAPFAPFSFMARAMWDHLAKHFFSKKYCFGRTLNVEKITEDFYEHMDFRNSIVLMMEDLGLIEIAEFDGLGCLYVAEKLDLWKVYSAAREVYTSWDGASPLNNELLDRFAKRFRRWTPRNTAFPCLRELIDLKRRKT